MQFGTKPPVRSSYAPPNPESQGTDYYGGIMPDSVDPAFMAPDTALTYDSDQGFLFDYGNDKSLEQLYFRCPIRKPRRR